MARAEGVEARLKATLEAESDAVRAASCGPENRITSRSAYRAREDACNFPAPTVRDGKNGFATERRNVTTRSGIGFYSLESSPDSVERLENITIGDF